MAFKNTVWAKEEEQYIMDNYGKMTYKEMAEKLGKTLTQVNGKIQHLRKRGLVEKSKIEKVIPEIEKEVEGTGLDLTSVNLEIGKEYEAFMPKQENAKLDDYFKGIFIQDTSRHITLKNKLGYCQSFLKADILIKIIQVKEVSK